jgi:hypothetical protein
VGEVEACDQGFLIRERGERMGASSAGIEQGKAAAAAAAETEQEEEEERGIEAEDADEEVVYGSNERRDRWFPSKWPRPRADDSVFSLTLSLALSLSIRYPAFVSLFY